MNDPDLVIKGVRKLKQLRLLPTIFNHFNEGESQYSITVTSYEEMEHESIGQRDEKGITPRDEALSFIRK